MSVTFLHYRKATASMGCVHSSTTLQRGKDAVEESTLVVEECNEREVRMKLRFDTVTYTYLDKSLVNHLEYRISIHNVTRDKNVTLRPTTTTFFVENRFSISIEDIPGHPNDYFDVRVTVLKVITGKMEPVHVSEVKLGSYQKLLLHKRQQITQKRQGKCLTRSRK